MTEEKQARKALAQISELLPERLVSISEGNLALYKDGDRYFMAYDVPKERTWWERLLGRDTEYERRKKELNKNVMAKLAFVIMKELGPETKTEKRVVWCFHCRTFNEIDVVKKTFTLPVNGSKCSECGIAFEVIGCEKGDPYTYAVSLHV